MFGVVPDIMNLAKQLTNGAIPMGAVVASKEIYQTFMGQDLPLHAVEFSHGHTYSAHPVACAAGLAALELLEQDNLLQRSAELAPHFEQGLHQLRDSPNVIDIRNLGREITAKHYTFLDAAIEHKADIIGLSGLITPSLEEMTHVAREMQRQGFETPLLIGGATTSRAHTALKIDPHYGSPVVWVKDASRAVGVTQSLLSAELRGPFVAANAADYAEVRARHANRGEAKPLMPLARARAKLAAQAGTEVRNDALLQGLKDGQSGPHRGRSHQRDGGIGEGRQHEDK